MTPYPQNVSSALHFLRSNRISVSAVQPTSAAEPTRWCVSTYPQAFEAAELVALATAKGFGQ